MNSNNFSTDNKFMEKMYKKPFNGDKLNHLIKLSKENDIAIIYKSNIKSVDNILKDCDKQKKKLIKQSALDLNELSKSVDNISIDVISNSDIKNLIIDSLGADLASLDIKPFFLTLSGEKKKRIVIFRI